MQKASQDHINQYKIPFHLSWIILYFFFPAWRNPQLYISFTNKVIDVPLLIHLLGFIVYFFSAAIIINFILNKLFVDEPLIVCSEKPFRGLKDNLALIIFCFIAAALHLFNYSLALGTSSYSLWIYRFMTDYWHKMAGFPIQYPIWISLFLLLTIWKLKSQGELIPSIHKSGHSVYKSGWAIKFILMVIAGAIFMVYAIILPPYSIWDHIFITGEPPVGTLLYLFVYLLFGTANLYLPSVVVQLTFYILSSVFLYKTIALFCEKETALLGAAIYLFSPLVFTYATLGHLQSGVVFFIVINSFFFLKFIRDGQNKDLILTAYFISIGCLYKREIIFMFFICSAYLIVHKILQKEFSFKKHITYIKVLSLSLIFFIPWYFIGTRGADTVVLSHLEKLEALTLAFFLLPSQLSWPIFLLFICSTITVLTGRRHLSIFFGILFIFYYVLYSSLSQQTVHRYTMALYPSIAVFVALFMSGIIKRIKWRHTFKLVFSILTIYLVVLCIVPRSSTNLITFKYTDFENQNFPFNKSVDWLYNKTGENNKVLALIRGREEITNALRQTPQNKFYFLSLGELNNLWPSYDLSMLRQVLNNQYEKNNISHIMFPVTKAEITHPAMAEKAKKIMMFLEENRHGDYVLAAKFNLDDNYIYIYKLRDKFVSSQ